MQGVLAWIAEEPEELEAQVELVPRHMLQGPKPVVQFEGSWLATNLGNHVSNVQFPMSKGQTYHWIPSAQSQRSH